MKMTLDQLRVDSYATQVSETELTEVKGGTWLQCFKYAVLLVLAGLETMDEACGGPCEGGDVGGSRPFEG